MCFTATYQKGDKVDYFTCGDCKINCTSRSHDDDDGSSEIANALV